jgi:hypothetical protein
MADPEYVARIRAYLEEHRHAYDRDALRQKLLADGHSAEAVDLASAQVYGFQVGTAAAPAPRSNTPGFLSSLLGVLALNFVGLPILLTLLGRITGFGLAINLLIMLLALVGEGVVAGVLWRRNQPVARGLAWGVAGSLAPLLLLLVLFGICLALIGGLSF